MFAILMKSNHEVAIIDLGDVTMPALYVKEEDANKVLYKNDLNTHCYVAPVRADFFILGNTNDSANSTPTSGND
ncbi:hypothetical protein MYOV011v1_p0116 [Vibrio phage 6E35.1a]|nr:hypothetical protein MYOV011v1_p0116 [Vibrio phage 6E35.1a]